MRKITLSIKKTRNTIVKKVTFSGIIPLHGNIEVNSSQTYLQRTRIARI